MSATSPSMSSTEPPVGVPVYGASGGQAIRRFLRGYVAFEGRASRSEFLWPMLVFSGIILILSTLLVVGMMLFMAFGSYSTFAATSGGHTHPDDFIAWMFGSMGVFFAGYGVIMLLSLSVTLPSYAVQARRLRDAGFPAMVVLLNLVGVGIVPFVMCCMPTKVEQPGGYAAAPYAQPSPFGQSGYGQNGSGQTGYWQQPPSSGI